MSQPIIFKITEAGKQAALNANADSAQIKVNLTQVAIGSEKYTPDGNETTLKTEIKREAIVSGGVELASNTLRFTGSLTADTVTEVYEIGLMTDNNVLFAVAASATAPLITLHPDVTFVTGFGLSFGEIDARNITVSIDPNGALSIVLMQQHLAAANPHPQYASKTLVDDKIGAIEQWQDNHLSAADPHPQYLDKSRFQLLLQTMIPLGYLHYTHETANPKPLFDELMGLDTAWRRITGKIMLASDPNDPFIRTHSLVLGQRGLTTEAEANRPHVYPVQTSNVFERYDPSAPIETVWNVASNKVAIGEGEAVRFTITVNNLPDGQILDWTVKEGELNPTNDDITTPEKTDSGTVIIKNAQAVIDFQTVADNNEVDPQKYVRLTVGAPANLSINVPIADAGHNETVVHISQSTNDGIVLDEYYKAQFGAYPLASDNIRFIVDNGVDIVAPDTQTPAIQAGVNWSAESPPTVENRGRILGRGGDGGRSAYIKKAFIAPFGTDGYINTVAQTKQVVPAEAGKDGGICLKGDFNVDNYGVVAGGGGGGGGMGMFFNLDASHEELICGGGGTGGGAPFGLSSPNEHTVKSHLSDPTVLNKVRNKPPFRDPPYFDIQQNADKALANVLGKSSAGLDDYDFPLSDKADNQDNTRWFVIPLDKNLKPIEPYTSSYNEYYLYLGTSSQNKTLPFRMSTDATKLDKGLGGAQYGLGIFQWQLFPSIQNPSISVYDNHGGDGGSFGENGQQGQMQTLFKPVHNSSGSVTGIQKASASTVHIAAQSAPGGLAGFVKEGDVTIRNLGNGITKGR